MGVGPTAHNANRWDIQVRSLNGGQASSDDQADFLASADHLVSYGCRTKGTQVFVLFSFRENQKETLAHRHGSAALWTIEFGGVKFLKRFRLVPMLGSKGSLIDKIPTLHGSRMF